MSEAAWPIEDVPDDDLLFRHVHRTWRRKNGEIAPSAFVGRMTSPNAYELSTDWCRYSTPEDTRMRARNPMDCGVYEALVGQIRTVPGQSVVHAPVQNDASMRDNRAHCDVIGPDQDDPEVKRLFSRYFAEVIPVPG